jgi:hypothetical protein
LERGPVELDRQLAEQPDAQHQRSVLGRDNGAMTGA